MAPRPTLRRAWGRAFAAAIAALILTSLPGLLSAAADTPNETAMRLAAIAPGGGEISHVAPIPPILSRDDRIRYARIFALQERGDWPAADWEISQLSNRLLMGHVLAQRYLHPTAYRSKYSELARWLETYADHPNAPRIHRLALKRRPQGAKRPHPPNLPPAGPLLVEETGWEPPQVPAKQRSKSEEARLDELQREMQQRMRSGWPTGARRILESQAYRDLVSDAEYDAARTRIAWSYFIYNKDDLALDLAAESAARSRGPVPTADWVAGLAAWRLGALQEARRHFTKVAESETASPWQTTAGAYWTSRVEQALDHPAQQARWLEIAAERPRTFYGMLAASALGLKPTFNWTVPPLTEHDIEVALRLPSVVRAIALVEVGQSARAERELRHIYPHATPALAEALLPLAQRLNLPAVQMGLSTRLTIQNGRRYDSAAYPLPSWEPKPGYTVDPALIYALIRKESHFMADAKSSRGARGLMQLMPATARLMARVTGQPGANDRSLVNPEFNILLGQSYVERLLDNGLVDGNLVYLLAAYNAGPGNLEKWMRETIYDGDPLLFVESIRWSETRDFIKRVLTNYWIYRAQMGQTAPSLDAVVRGDWPRYAPDDVVYASDVEDQSKPPLPPRQYRALDGVGYPGGRQRQVGPSPYFAY